MRDITMGDFTKNKGVKKGEFENTAPFPAANGRLFLIVDRFPWSVEIPIIKCLHFLYIDREDLTLTAIETNIVEVAEMRDKTNICASIDVFVFYIYTDINRT